MKIQSLLFVTTLFSFSLFAQKIDKRIAKTTIPLSEVARIALPELDNAALLAAEMERRAPGIAPKFAENLEVNITPETDGTWETLRNGIAVWRLRIYSKDAKSLNLGFTKYYMPPGGKLVLYSADYQRVMGPFTPSDNEEHEQLWTPVLTGDELVVEVQLPEENRSELRLELQYVNHDFLGFGQILSGSCNLDVICGAADGWEIVEQYRDIIQSVAVIGLNGGTFCTGFLVNNARNDCTPYFMTAFHCGIDSGNAASFVAYWNFQNSSCRQPDSPGSGGPGNGTLNLANTGAFFKAGWSQSDFTLIELDDPIPDAANAFLAGWSAENIAPSDTVICIHHPSTDEKRISFEFDPTHPGNWDSGPTNVPNGNHVVVPDWDIGTTEPGSSGSPLFNNQRQVVGQLHGGGAACGNNDYDTFGGFHASWEGGGTPTTRLKDWLDPDNLGIVTLNGKNCNFTITPTQSMAELCAPDSAVFTILVSDNFENDVMLGLNNLPANGIAAFEMNPVPPGGTTTLTITNTDSIPSGTHVLELTGTDSIEETSTQLQLVVFAQPPLATSLVLPVNGAMGTSTSPSFEWENLPNLTYEIEVATDSAFANIVETASGIQGNNHTSSVILNILTDYFWRVRGTNVCGTGEWSETFSLSTASIICGPSVSVDVPHAISPDGTPTISSTLEVSIPGFVDDVNVTGLEITHTWAGDLTISVTSPSGTTVVLMNQIPGGDGGCDGANLLLDFDDEAANDYSVLDQSCNGNPAAQGSFQPLNPLSAFNGEPNAGTWTLTVTDNANADGGSLDNWGLDLCSTVPTDFSLNPTPAAIKSCLNDAASFTLLPGTAFSFDAGVTLFAEGLPTDATISFAQNPVPPGSVVEVTVSGASVPGDFAVQIFGTDGADTSVAEVIWTVMGPPEPASLSFPANNAIGISTNPTYIWDSVSYAINYSLEVATDTAFANIIETAAGIEGTTHNSTVSLNILTDYFWHLRTTSNCGTGEWSETFTFSTAIINCGTNISGNVPLIISLNGTPTISSTLEVSIPGFVDDVNLTDLDVNHSWVGDLRVLLTSPSGTSVVLMDQIPVAGGGCSGDNLLLNFDDEATDAYSVLDQTCNDNPAAQGSFQPLEPLSAFNGEPIAGTWTLTIVDNANLDGGVLNNWGIDLCSTAPTDFSLNPAPTDIESCLNDAASFTLLPGTAFSFDAGVTLSAEGLPTDATISFAQNPATPGSLVETTVSGASVPGDYVVQIFGTDGADTSVAEIIWTVVGAPEPATLNFPANDATGISINPTLIWSPVSGAINYTVEVATDALFTNIVQSSTITGTSTSSSGLVFGTTYFWRVNTTNQCDGTLSAIFQFTTFLDLNFTVSPANTNACLDEAAAFTLQIGVSFDATGVSLSANGLPSLAEIAFDNNPAAPGSTVEITISGLGVGTFPITIVGDDGTQVSEAEITVTVEAPAIPTTLTEPENGATNVPVEPVFSWETVAGVNGYVFELATDNGFADIIETVATAQTSLTLTDLLLNETIYYWRVTAQNDCGGTPSQTFVFTSEAVNAVTEIQGIEISIQPNPTSGELNILFSQPLSEKINLQVYSINGRKLQQRELNGMTTTHSVDLSAYASGIYFVKMLVDNEVLIEKIVLQK